MRAGKAAGPAPFLVKTHEIVEDHRTDEVISWTADGAAFVVWKPVEFARDLLPNHFKHNNLSSFVRQLNIYGFRKVVLGRWEFTNDHFRRGQPNLLSLIQRRRNSPQAAVEPKDRSPSATSSKDHNQRQSFTSTATATASASASASSLPQPLGPTEQENQALKKANQILKLELAKVKQQKDLLLGFLSRYIDLTALHGTIDVGGGGGEESPKLFGVCLREAQEEKTRKRGWCNSTGSGDGEGRPTKMIAF